MNERSSRSHSVFTLKVKGYNPLTEEKCEAMLNLGKSAPKLGFSVADEKSIWPDPNDSSRPVRERTRTV